MPIQFQCKACDKWIEVDDENAGGQAICPFCQAVNAVPAKPAREPPLAGRDGRAEQAAGPAEPTQPPDRPDRWGQATDEPGAFDARREGLPVKVHPRAWVAWLGPIGFAASLVGLVGLLGAAAVLGRQIPPETVNRLATATDRVAQHEAMQELNGHLMQIGREQPGLLLAMFGGMLLMGVGFVLSTIGAVLPGLHRRRWAYAGMAVGGFLLLLCVYSGIMFGFGGN